MNSASPVKVGVVGVGSMGQNHARVYANLPNAELVCVYDADQARAAEVAASHGAKVAPSIRALAEQVDAASIVTPTVTHLEVGSVLLDAGVHVLIEKPLAETLDDAKSLIDLARLHQRSLQVGHIERFNPVMAQLERHLDAPKFIESHRLSPFPNRSIDIGVVLDLMIHDLEIILHLVNSPIAHIDAVGIPVLTHREDIANARIRFENGCVANITASRISPDKMRKIRVFQGDAYLSLDYGDQSGWIYRKDGMEIKRDAVEIERDEPLKLELSAFVECAARGETPKVSGEHGAAALDVALEITRMIEEADQKSS